MRILLVYHMCTSIYTYLREKDEGLALKVNY